MVLLIWVLIQINWDYDYNRLSIQEGWTKKIVKVDGDGGDLVVEDRGIAQTHT